MVSCKCSLFVLSPSRKKIKTWTRFPPKENPNMEKALFNWPVMLQYNVKAKYRLIPRKFSGKKFFQPKADHARLYPFGKSLYFRSFVVSVLFPRFHFKLIRIWLYKGGKVYELF